MAISGPAPSNVDIKVNGGIALVLFFSSQSYEGMQSLAPLTSNFLT
jgi:hypothetical protein